MHMGHNVPMKLAGRGAWKASSNMLGWNRHRAGPDYGGREESSKSLRWIDRVVNLAGVKDRKRKIAYTLSHPFALSASSKIWLGQGSARLLWIAGPPKKDRGWGLVSVKAKR